MKIAIGTASVAMILMGGAIAGIQTASDTGQATSQPGTADASHPECYDSTKMNDPADFCYQTIGPWNSRVASVEEVRSTVSLSQMITAGHTTAQIQRYYPEYQPKAG